MWKLIKISSRLSRGFCPLLIGFLGISSQGLADVKLSPLFGNGMVLQQSMPIQVWGTANPSENIQVTFDGTTVSAVADPQGKWRATLPAHIAGGPFQLECQAENKVVFQDVWVGEVWICSGQSNMSFEMSRETQAKEEIAQADCPQLHLFTVKRAVSDHPIETLDGKWNVCQPKTVASFSAVSYFFGRELSLSLKVPIGLIHTSWAGTQAECWSSHETLLSDPDYQPIFSHYQKFAAEKHDESVDYLMPSGLYNAMIMPLVPYSIRGVIWYQGEGNSDRAYQYRKLFPAMIRNWRQVWRQGDFPFLFVQLPNYKPVQPQPTESNWAELREAQLRTLSLPKTGMAVTIDLGDPNNVHPPHKKNVGIRLAKIAQGLVYEQPVVYSAPLYDSYQIENDSIRIKFQHVEDGLISKDGELKGFAIAGENKKFVWADARIDGSTVIVKSPQVPKPIAVRYAWADNPVCTLYNRSGLPASPFRTDDWPGKTIDHR